MTAWQIVLYTLLTVFALLSVGLAAFGHWLVREDRADEIAREHDPYGSL